MKKIFRLNKIVVIINLILFVVPYFGLLFMILTGVTQLVFLIIYLLRWKHIEMGNQRLLIIYLILVIAVLSLMFSGQYWMYGRDTLTNILLLISGLLAFFSVYISKEIGDFKNTENDF